MREINLCTPNDDYYLYPWNFSRIIYQKRIKFQIQHKPDFLFFSKNNGVLECCIGLNTSLKNPLFTKNEIVKDFSREEKLGEQAIFAFKNIHWPSIESMAVILTLYANHLGIKKIALTEIEISKILLEKTKIETIEAGYAKKENLNKEDESNYAEWFKNNKPKIKLANTDLAAELFSEVTKKYQREVSIGSRLKKILNLPRGN